MTIKDRPADLPFTRTTIEDYAPLIGDHAVEQILEKAAALRDLHVVNINSTYYGGGVAEILSSLTLMMNSAGIKTGWRVIQGRPDFFSVTKKMHNALQGGDINLTDLKTRIYEEVAFENARRIHLDHDIVIVHDPQPLPLICHFRKKAPWVWRCHIDLSAPHPDLWAYLAPFIEHYDAVVLSLPEYAQNMTAPQRFITPAINPFSTTNTDLTENEINDRLSHYDIPTDAPLVVQVSRFDKLKDPQGVINAFRTARREVDCTLVLVGNVATDDPEGQEIFESLCACGEGRIRILSVQDSALVNALQRRAVVVLQKSLRERQRVSGTGSGFFISADGYILTNNHVVKDAIKIKITDINEKEYIAKKIGADPKTDLALLKIKGNNFPFIELGDSDELEVGEWVLAIGNPLGQDLSVTSGIVSAKGRELEGLEVDYQNFIQTDAAINQGNSGGPLINMEGKAIGINSVILSTSGGNIGIGFSIPSNMAKKVIGDLKKEGRVIRGYMGVSVQYIPDEEAKDYGFPQGGIIIAKVDEDTPAKEAGLKKYDLIVEVDGTKVKSARELRNLIASHSPGDVVRLTIYRGNDKKTINVKVTEAPESVRIRSGEDDDEGKVIDLGMVLRNNSRSLARQYELGTSEGIVVMEVERGGVAYENGLQAGYVIIGVNRVQIGSVRQFREIMAGKSHGDRVLMTIVRRDGNENMVRFRIPE
jgi:trehalose synthase